MARNQDEGGLVQCCQEPTLDLHHGHFPTSVTCRELVGYGAFAVRSVLAHFWMSLLIVKDPHQNSGIANLAGAFARVVREKSC